MCDQPTSNLYEFVKYDYEVSREEFRAMLPAAFAKIYRTSEITVKEVVKYDEPGTPTMFLATARGHRIANREGEGAYCVI